MNNITKVDADAFDWLRKINLKYWSVHGFDKSVKCDHITNNMTESWNAWFGDMSKAPIITMMEHIRRKMMQAIIERKLECQGWRTEVLSCINKKMNKLLKDVKVLSCYTSKSYMTNNKKSFVNLKKHTCDYRLWQINGLPCSYAMHCIAHLRATYEPYIAACFTKETYLRCYSCIIHLLLDKSKWPHIEADEILPLNISRPPSRPRNCRRREVGEAPSHNCRGIGHNTRCCPHNPTNASKKTKTMMVNLVMIFIINYDPLFIIS